MGVTEGWSYETELAAHGRSASSAREFVTLHLLAHGLEYLVDDLRLVVSELAANAMLHAQTPFTVMLAALDESVMLNVWDGSQTTPVLLDPDVLDTRGRGLMIVDALSRDWGVVDHPDGKSVWAEFDRRSSPKAGTPQTTADHAGANSPPVNVTVARLAHE